MVGPRRDQQWVVGTGSLERQTQALPWDGGLECRNFILKAVGSHGGIWSRRGSQSPALRNQMGVCAGRTHRGNGARGLSLYTCPRSQMEKLRPREGGRGESLAARGGSRAGVCVSLQELTQGREGQVWLLGWGLGEGSLAQPHAYQASSWAGMRVGSQESHPCPAGWEGWNEMEVVP